MQFRYFRKLALAGSAALAFAYFGCGSDDGGGGEAGSGAANSGGGGAAGNAAGGTSAGGGGSGGTGAGINVGGSDSGNTGGGAGDACASTIVDSKLVPANLLFVIDRSGSMNCNLPSDGQPSSQCDLFPKPIDTTKPTKWALTKTALQTAVDDLETSGNVSAGLVVFPRPNTECGVTQTPDVPIQTLNAAQNTALDTFLDGVTPIGGTPLAGSTILSYAYLYDLLKAGTVQGNLFVVLLTDGYESCALAELDKLINQDVPNASNLLNIRTFVIGVPGSENGRALLSQIAWQGGTPKTTSCKHSPTPADVGDCHFDMTTSPNFAQDLKTALTQISGAVLSCEIDVPAPPPGKKINYNNVKVSVSSNPVPQDNSTTCDQANGWQFSQDKTKIYLCGTACGEAKKPGAQIALDLGCLSDIR